MSVTKSATRIGLCPAQIRLSYHDGLLEDLAAAQSQQPVFYSSEIGHWVVTRYADVTSVLHDAEHFSCRNATTRLTPFHDDAIQILREGGFNSTTPPASIDPPAHARIRRAENAALNPRVVAGLQDRVRDLVKAQIAKLPSGGEIDLVQGFNYELPAKVIFHVLGLDEADIPNVKRWAASRAQVDFSPSSYDQQIASAKNLVEFWRFCVDLVQDRLKSPREDFTSALLRYRNGDDALVTINEIETLTYGLGFAGHETTTNQLTNGFQALLMFRDQWDALVADPSLAPGAVEESLRFCGSVIGWRRTALAPVELGGVVIPQGAKILLSFAAANRDAAIFPDPGRFDIRRANANKHLTMGQGAHFCLGASLARLEMRVVFEEFAKAYPRVRLHEGQQPSHLASFVLRAPEHLQVQFE
jgi:cytochrome P450